MDALKKQVGGNHYKKLEIQPIEFIQAFNLTFTVGNVVKYLVRDKNRQEDLEKAYHYLELSKGFKYNKVLENCAIGAFINDTFFEQFKHGRTYAQVVALASTGNTAKAKRLLRSFINDGDFSEV